MYSQEKSSRQLRYVPRSKSGRYTHRGNSSPPLSPPEVDHNIVPNTLSPVPQVSSPLVRQRAHALAYSEKAAQFEYMFPVSVVLDEGPLTEFKEQDRAEAVHYWSGKGREEEKHVLAARALLEKEEDNGLVVARTVR